MNGERAFTRRFILILGHARCFQGEDCSPGSSVETPLGKPGSRSKQGQGGGWGRAGLGGEGGKRAVSREGLHKCHRSGLQIQTGWGPVKLSGCGRHCDSPVSATSWPLVPVSPGAGENTLACRAPNGARDCAPTPTPSSSWSPTQINYLFSLSLSFPI